MSNSNPSSLDNSTKKLQQPIETTSAPITPNPMLAAVQSLSVDGKNKLVAIWMSKERIKKFKTIEILNYLDKKWEEVYNIYITKDGFSAAQLKANTYVLSLVYGK